MSIFCDIMSPEYINMSRQFYVNHDHCGNPEHYENYIRQDCFTDYKQGMGVTHVFVDDEKGRIIGYITLRATSLIMDIGENYRLGYPALEIAELAVEKDYERQGIGAEMVMYAINMRRKS